MIRLGVTGALGRMGSSIIRLAADMKDFNLTGAFERKGHSDIGKPVSGLLGLSSKNGTALAVLSAAAFKKADIVIDFSGPEATLAALELAREAGCGMVIGTTGLTEAQRAEVKTASNSIPVVFAPNMSLGANLVFELARIAAERLDESYDIEITEAHHRLKKDAPSGTARRLAEGIAEAKGWKLDAVAKYGREGLTGARPSKQIGIHVIRAGEIVGDHTAIFSGPGETIEITHRAHSRNAFAKGALLAARFAAGHKKGLFDMLDVLNARIGPKKSK